MSPDSGITITNVEIKKSDGTWAPLEWFKGVDFAKECGEFALSNDEFNKYILGIWNNDDVLDAFEYAINDIKLVDEFIKERNDNMNILELYEKRKREEIKSFYKDKINKEYESLEVVKEYKELINTFNINMKQLAEKYNTNDTISLTPTCYNNDYSYELSHSLYGEIEEKYDNQAREELEELQNFVEEVKAVLSLSDDKDYQLDVLKNYEILDKKGMLDL